MSRDMDALQKQFAGRERGLQGTAGNDAVGVEQKFTDWGCGELAREVTQSAGKLRVRGYPSLVDRGDHVQVRVLDSLEAARQAHR